MTARLLSLALLPLLLCDCSLWREEGETRFAGDAVLSPALMREALHGKVDFARHVAPILAARCVACHGGPKAAGQWSLADAAQARDSGVIGGWIVAGQPAQSRILMALEEAHAKAPLMPPVGATLSADQRLVLSRWIQQGALWPVGPAGRVINPEEAASAP